MWHQVDDVMAAMRYLGTHAQEHHLNLGCCYLTGDSAGALLSLFVLALTGSAELRRAFGIAETGLSFRAAALVSIMLDTQRRDLMCAISDTVTNEDDRGRAYEQYLLDPQLARRRIASAALSRNECGRSYPEGHAQAGRLARSRWKGT